MRASPCAKTPRPRDRNISGRELAMTTTGGGMTIRLLGPLEVIHDGRPITLGGVKQRATLGLLALRANQIVPTSHLMGALWPGEDPPMSARKMLQNAVWSLRAALSVVERPGGPRLATQNPGYALYVEPEQVDLLQFHEQVERGRAQLAGAAGPEAAARTLRGALGIWRGGALADLVESGIVWPELTSVDNARLDAFEDYVEAELACGRHQAVLTELEATAETEHLRERTCGQLMLALYRSGRHPDALAVYSRLRSSLVEDLGLEPSPALQSLQQAILNHEPDLLPPCSEPPNPLPIEVRVRPAGPTTHDATQNRDRAAVDSSPGPPDVPEPRRRPLSVVLVRVRLGTGFADHDPAAADTTQAAVTSRIRECLERLGGSVVASIGSTTLAAFRGEDDDSARAVRAALNLRAHLPADEEDPSRRTLVSQVAVVSGEALLQLPCAGADGPPAVHGSLIDECERLLSTVPDDDIRVCGRTRNLTAGLFAYTSLDGTATWRLDRASSENVPAGHASELAVVRGLLDRTLVRQTSHLVTVTSQLDNTMSPFLAELERSIPDGAQLLTGRAETSDVLGAASTILATYCSVTPDNGPTTVVERLTAAVGRLRLPERHADDLLTRLLPLLARGSVTGRADPASTLSAWQHLLMLAARDRPLIVLLRDAHRGTPGMLNALESLADLSHDVPLFVVVATDPGLLHLRPGWGGGTQHSTSITLDPPRDRTLNRLCQEARCELMRVLPPALPGDGRRPGRDRRPHDDPALTVPRGPAIDRFRSSAPAPG